MPSLASMTAPLITWEITLIAPDSVVVGGDNHVHLIGIAVGVHNGYDGYVELVRFLNGDGFLFGIDDKDTAGHTLHIP